MLSLTIRIPKSLRDALRTESTTRGMSIADIFVEALTYRIIQVNKDAD